MGSKDKKNKKNRDKGNSKSDVMKGIIDNTPKPVEETFDETAAGYDTDPAYEAASGPDREIPEEIADVTAAGAGIEIPEGSEDRTAAAPDMDPAEGSVGETAVPSVDETVEQIVSEDAADKAEDPSAHSDRDTLEETKDRLKRLESLMEELQESTDALRKNAGRMGIDGTALMAMELEKHKSSKYRNTRKPDEKRSKRRSAEIFGVFARHNFYAGGLTPEELRTTLEDLGPTYVKIGQIMSSRLDLLPESYCKELEKLRQNVQELDPALARAVIEEETGKRIDEIFSEFRDKPLGSASVGQAHFAVLKDGRQVVIKVRRPHIAFMMHQDFVLLKKLARVFNVVTEAQDNPEEQLDLLEVIEEFEKVTEEELDFRTEACNTKFFKEYCIVDEEKVTCPDVIDELTTECMFTMSFVDGYSISNKDRVIADGFDPEEIGRNIVDNYVHQVLDVGVFHADPHQGNIMISHGRPVWIDFGMLGRITEGDISIIQSLVLAVLEKDVETIAGSIMSMGASTSRTNRDRLIEDLDVFLDRYCSVTSINDLDVSVLFDEICTLAAKHHVRMPGRFTMLVRSLGTIEGVIEQFCPELNLFEILSGKMLDRAKKSFDLEQEIASIGKDALEISRKAAKIPAIASDVLKGVARGRTKINLELTGYDELLDKAGSSLRSVVLTLFASILFVGSCILCLSDITPKAPGGIPVIAAAGLIFSVALAIYTVNNI